MNIKQFDYKGTSITFNCANGVMINATEMAKPFGKRPNDWLNLPSTKNFLSELTITRKSGNVDYQAVTTKKGGLNPTNGGTWLSEDAALEFARWLSPQFSIWCNDRIKELLTTGITTITNDDEAILHAIQVLQKRVEESKARVKELETNNTQLLETISEQAPKVLFADAVVGSNDSILIRQFAKVLQQNNIKMGERALFKYFRDNGYLLVKGESYNLPSQKAMQSGLFCIKKTEILNPNGELIIHHTPKLTGKGQIYFLNKIKNI